MRAEELNTDSSKMKESGLKSAWNTRPMQKLALITIWIPHTHARARARTNTSQIMILTLLCLMLFVECRWSHNGIWLRRGRNMIEFSVSPLRLDCETRFPSGLPALVNQSLNFETYDTQREVSFEDGCYFVGQSFFKGWSALSIPANVYMYLCAFREAASQHGLADSDATALWN